MFSLSPVFTYRNRKLFVPFAVPKYRLKLQHHVSSTVIGLKYSILT